MATLTPYQKNFVNFLVSSGSLTFGDFMTKSGRKTPYFINTGNFNNGSRIEQLSRFYAEHIKSNFPEKVDVIFGPAYKGIPLCVATCMTLAREFAYPTGFSFDRKESKQHGDKGRIVGHQLQDGDRVVIVEDVVTAGTTLKEIVPALRSLCEVDIAGVVISVDRCERGGGADSAVKELERELGIRIFPVVTIHQVISYLSEKNESGFQIDQELKQRINDYLGQYAA